MIDSLARTRPWVLLVGIVMMVLVGFMVLGAIALIAVGNIAALGGEGLGPLGGAGLGAIYLLLAILYVFPALYLLRYAGAIKRIGPANPGAMEEALRQQASFWRFVGILTATFLVAYALLIVAIAVMAVIGAGASS
jgi:hypothetical protein